MMPSNECFEQTASDGLDGPLIKVEVEMVWQGKTRRKPGWVHMKTGEVQLREGEYWCENPRVHLAGNAWDVELERYVFDGEVKGLRQLPEIALEAFCLSVVNARAAHLEDAINLPGSPAPIKPRF